MLMFLLIAKMGMSQMLWALNKWRIYRSKKFYQKLLEKDLTSLNFMWWEQGLQMIMQISYCVYFTLMKLF